MVKRKAVGFLVSELALSERRSCRIVGLTQLAQHYRPKPRALRMSWHWPAPSPAAWDGLEVCAGGCGSRSHEAVLPKPFLVALGPVHAIGPDIARGVLL